MMSSINGIQKSKFTNIKLNLSILHQVAKLYVVGVLIL